MTWKLLEGDCLEVLASIPDGSIDAVITDPPYGLDFMGKAWDHGVPGVPFWEAAIRTLRPGGYALIFGGTRTYHRLACAVEDAGFEIRDCLMWLYGQGFPKGQACLKPAWEPILLARKPAKRMTPLNVDECRISTNGEVITAGCTHGGDRHDGYRRPYQEDKERVRELLQGAVDRANTLGRYPANVVHDGSDEVMEAFALFGHRRPRGNTRPSMSSSGTGFAGGHNRSGAEYSYGDTGTAGRFFYCAKASKSERGLGNNHPTVKPLSLIRWLVRLITPSNGTVLDPFAGSGTLGVAVRMEGRNSIMIEREPQYCDIIRRRMAEAEAKTATPLFDTKEDRP